MNNIITDAMQEEFKENLKNALDDLVTGASEDIVYYVNQVTRALVESASITDPQRRIELLQELSSQLLLTNELNRLRTVNANWNIVVSTINAVLSSLVRAAII